jgi:hypothetical protein
MLRNYSLFGNLWWLILPLVIVDLVLKGLALWKTARHGQNIWFVAILIVNSLGILPAVYLLFFQKKK